MAGFFDLNAFAPEYLEGDGWSLDWNGGPLNAQMLEAARRAIDELNLEAVAIALAHPMWDNRTGQTEEAVFFSRAEWDAGQQQMWGVWGVEDRPRLDDDDLEVWWSGGSSANAVSAEGNSGWSPDFNEGDDRMLTTKDVALFLEFGTVKMLARPWLYPAFNATKTRLGAKVAEWYAILDRENAGNRLRDTGGRFTSFPEA
jgi:hypothetical protein